jgi:acetyl esterase/lipase
VPARSPLLVAVVVAAAIAAIAAAVVLTRGDTEETAPTSVRPTTAPTRAPVTTEPEVEDDRAPVEVEVVITTIPYGPDPQQVAEVRRRSDVERGPAVVLVHGGCWNSGSVERWDETAAVLADDGYVVWAGTYRHHDGEGRWQTQPDDVAALVARVRADPHVDPDRVVIGGDSSGGHLALLHAYRHRDVAGVLSLSGVTDPEAWVAAGSELSRCFPPFAGGGPGEAPPGRYDELSPLRAVTPGVPATAVVASIVDPITRFPTQAEPLLAALDEVGAPRTAIVVDECPGNEHVDHGTRLLVCTLPDIRSWLEGLLRP